MSTPPIRRPSAGQLRSAVRAFDGADLDPTRRLAATLPADAEMVSRLLALLPSQEDSLEMGATWLVKNLLERCAEPLPARRARRLVHRLIDCRLDWSRLHLLQCLQHTQLGDATCRELEPTLWQWLEDIDHGFTRAWVYDALVRVGRDGHRDRSELAATLAGAYDRERPAVRARLRHLIRQLEDDI